MENENQTPHKRRVHYKGKYPKKFEEKYKELQPEKYKDRKSTRLNSSHPSSSRMPSSA